MAVPTLVSTRGKLLLAIGVAISAGFASSKSIGFLGSDSEPSLLETHGFVIPIEPFAVTKAEECVLIFDNNVQGIFVYDGETCSGKPVYRKIKDDGDWSDRYVFNIKKGEWNYAPSSKNPDPDYRFGYAESTNTLCPDDGSVFRYLLWEPNKHFGVTGKVYRALPPTWATCKPVPGNPRGLTSSQMSESFPSLTECARHIAGVHPDAAGAQWEKNNHKCMALWGDDGEIVHKEPKGAPPAVGCIFDCPKLPKGRSLPNYS